MRGKRSGRRTKRKKEVTIISVPGRSGRGYIQLTKRDRYMNKR